MQCKSFDKSLNNNENKDDDTCDNDDTYDYDDTYDVVEKNNKESGGEYMEVLKESVEVC